MKPTSKTSIPQIVIDTREQTPWSFGEAAEVIRACLPAGDYSLAGLERIVAVERKSLHDFVNTVIHSKNRFIEEITRLGFYKHTMIVVEGSLEDVTQERYKSKANPKAILGIAATLHTAHGIPVYWCGDRAHASLWAFTWLSGIWKQRQRLIHEADIGEGVVWEP